MARTRETFGSHANTAHAWAQGSYSHGRASDGRVFFSDGALYSHGSHFTIARILPDKFKGRRVVLWNRESYSISTSRHQSYARDALRGLHDLIVPVWNLDRESDKDKRESWESLIEALAAPSGVTDGDWKSPDYEPRQALNAFRAHYKTRWPIPADPVKHVAARKAERARKKLAARRNEVLRVAKGINPARNFEPERESAYSLESAVKQCENYLTELRSARLTLGKLKRYGASVRAVSAEIKRLTPFRDALKTRHVWAVKAERRESDLADLADADAKLAKGEKLEGRIFWNREYLARFYWPLAIETGMERVAAAIHDAIQTTQYADELEARFPTPVRQYGETISLDEWRAGKGSAHAQIKGLDSYSGPTLVRKLGDRLQTSRGAETSWRDAKRVFFFAQARRRTAEPWHRNGEQFRVGPYSLDAIDADGNITAGCHKIPWGEMEACALREFPQDELRPTFPLPVPVKGV